MISRRTISSRSSSAAAIDFGDDSIRGVGLIQHPRGRVGAEERGRVLPGPFFRWLFGGLAVRLFLARFRKYQVRGQLSASRSS